MSVATATELWRLSATELAEVIRSKQASSREVVDRAVSDGDPLPPFHGVPFTVKGNIDLVGTPTTHAAKALVGAFPTLDAPVVERLKAAGAIPIGRANLPTFALRWHTDSELCGPTINPWDRSRTAGASSTGEAAALATELTAVQGPLARRVADLRAALEVLAGPTWRDPWSVPAPLRRPEPTKPGRVDHQGDPAGQGTATQVQDGVRKAARALVDAGYAVEEVEPPSIEVAAKTLLYMATAVNTLGLPAVALPVGIGDGLPQAVQVIGPRYHEDLCLAAAAALADRVGTITPIDPRWR